MKAVVYEGVRDVAVNELQSNLRHGGYFDMSQVEFAILEPTGKFSIQPKGSVRPPSRPISTCPRRTRPSSRTWS